MSLSVTKELDVFDALALLLNIHGIIVKNEIYFEKFSQVFDYTMEIYFDSPVICSQVAVLGSNNVDFFHAPVYDHGLDNFLYKDLHQDDTRHRLMHDYRRNFAPEAACHIDEPEEPTEQMTATGIVAILNVEHVRIQLDPSILALIEEVATAHRLSILSTHFLYQTGVVVCREGYVVARVWPEHSYVGLDISMWSQTHLMPSIREALSDALASDSHDVSGYRVVVGGIYGLDYWTADQNQIGPKRKQLRNCQDDVSMEGFVSSRDALGIAVEEVVPLSLSNETVALVVCGKEGSCTSKLAVSNGESVRQVVTIEECSNIFAFPTLDDFVSCELEIRQTLSLSLQGARANLVVMDETASFEMHQIVHSILEDDWLRQEYFHEHSIVVAWSSEPSQVVWKREFLDRIRKAVEFDPVSRTEIVVQAGGQSYELGVVSFQNENANLAYDLLEERMKVRLSIAPYNAKVELRIIHGSMFNYEDELTTTFFKLEDYDLSAAREQFKAQVPLGRQSIFQFARKVGEEFSEAHLPSKLSLAEVSKLLSMGLNDIDIGLSSSNQFVVGDGGVVLSLGYAGNFIAAWDGRSEIVVNFFSFDEFVGIPGRFVKNFEKAASQHLLQIKLRDDQPRGFNKVVNFASDLG
jgi:S-adenosylmethionine/arginine decarboxylase-like enzyme